jgi:hypothetical protein
MMSPRTVVEKGSVSVPLGWSTTAFQAYEEDLWDSFDANVIARGAARAIDFKDLSRTASIAAPVQFSVVKPCAPSGVR